MEVDDVSEIAMNGLFILSIGSFSLSVRAGTLLRNAAKFPIVLECGKIMFQEIHLFEMVQNFRGSWDSDKMAVKDYSHNPLEV